MGTYGNFFAAATVSLTASDSDFVAPFNDPNASGVIGSPITASFASQMSSSAEFSALVDYIHGRLGESIIQVELSPQMIAYDLNAAVFRFSYICNSFYLQSYIASMIGLSVNYNEIDFRNQLPRHNNTFLQMFTSNQENTSVYNQYKEKRRGFIFYGPEQQRQDIYANGIDADSGLPLEQYVASVSAYNVHFLEIFHGPGTYMNRLWSPEMSQQFMSAEFGFPTFPTDTVFYILPLWQDILRGQLLEASDYARKSAYRHNIYGRTLELIPRPQESFNVWFTYYLDFRPGTDSFPLQNSSFSGLSYLAASADNQVITQFANVPIKDLTYDSMNPLGRAWVREYTFALSMKTLARVRGKIPITLPDGQQITLDSSALDAEGTTIVNSLEAELKERLNEMDAYRILSKERQKAEDKQMILIKNTPMPFFMRRTIS